MHLPRSLLNDAIREVLSERSAKASRLAADAAAQILRQRLSGTVFRTCLMGSLAVARRPHGAARTVAPLRDAIALSRGLDVLLVRMRKHAHAASRRFRSRSVCMAAKADDLPADSKG